VTVASDACHPPDVVDEREHEPIEAALVARAAGAVDRALAFLEADPRYFRSGYAKQRILRRLANLPMTRDERARACTLIVRYVDRGASGALGARTGRHRAGGRFAVVPVRVPGHRTARPAVLEPRMARRTRGARSLDARPRCAPAARSSAGKGVGGHLTPAISDAVAVPTSTVTVTRVSTAAHGGSSSNGNEEVPGIRRYDELAFGIL
jgi:hypothetical protein